MNKDEIKFWLFKYGIINYTIHDDLTVDIHQSAHLNHRSLTSLPFQFGIILGVFWCDNNKLTSLEHCPKIVTGGFDCHNNNKLTSLEHCPKIVQGYFDCDESLKNDIRYLNYQLANQLKSL